MSRQRLSTRVRQTLSGPCKGAQISISHGCGLARPARNYASCSALLSAPNVGPLSDSPRPTKHHPPRIRPLPFARMQSTGASPEPPTSPFLSPFEPQAPPPPSPDDSPRPLFSTPPLVRPTIPSASASASAPLAPPAESPNFHHRKPRVHPTAPSNGEEVVAYFRELLNPLEIPEDLALRMITHTSWRGGRDGHNARLTFLGRRALRANMFMFLQSAQVHKPQSKYDVPSWDREIAAAVLDVLDTYKLGREVGRIWELERVMRWIPAMPDSIQTERVLYSTGLFKVRGATVEAVLGGLLHQYGGLVAHRAFQTRILPHISHRLPPAYRAAAQRVTNQMGGINAPLTFSPPRPAEPAEVEAQLALEQEQEHVQEPEQGQEKVVGLSKQLREATEEMQATLAFNAQQPLRVAIAK